MLVSEGKEAAGEGGGLSLATIGGNKVGEGGGGAVVGGVTVDVFKGMEAVVKIPM